MRNKLFQFTVAAFMFSAIAVAQTSSYPWAISAGANIISVAEDDADSGLNFGVPTVSISRHIAAGVSLGLQISNNNVEVDGADKAYTAWDALLKYNITEGKAVPYLFGGYGLSAFSDGNQETGTFELPSTEAARTVFGGVGVSYFVSDKFAINASASYRASDEKGAVNHLQHVIGVSYHLGKDTDKDGVVDKKDTCPEVPGLKEFDGCPDTDGDGIPDNKDACPEEAGPAELNGCPDNDGDGIPNKDDACPDAAGSAEMNGCPDTDGDGVADNVDKCPEEAGAVENDGCPWPDTDGDGIVDKDDACPEVAGVPEKDGCPAVEEPTKLIDFLNSDESKIQFSFNSAKIKENGDGIIRTISELLAEYPDAKILVAGHASAEGTESYNQKLSERRAEAVKAALVAKGVAADRVATAAYGESKPAADNASAAGRAKNRRVEIDRRVEISVQ